jgi:hypothetical protein
VRPSSSATRSQRLTSPLSASSSPSCSRASSSHGRSSSANAP